MNEEVNILINEAITHSYSTTNYSLSTFLSMLLRIAKKVDDQNLIFLIQLDSSTAGSDESIEVAKNFKKALLQKESTNFSNDQFKKTYDSLISSYQSRRKIISKDKKGNPLFYPMSITTLENNLKSLYKKNNDMKIPNNLAPLDVYYLNEKHIQQRDHNSTIIEEIEKVLLNTKSFYFNYLTEIEDHLTKQKNKIKINLLPKEKVGEIMSSNNKVFIIHGSNEAKRRELEDILRKLNLEPIVLSDQANRSYSIMDKFKKTASECSAAIALITADDSVENKSGDKYTQGRPNVWFELGWFYANLGQDKTILLYQDNEKNTIPSDLSGILQVRYNTEVKEAYMDLQKEFEAMGLNK